jgi:AhpD family alkylhydroperoxidase
LKEEKMNSAKTPWYILHAPEIGAKFDEFNKICCRDGVLDKKTKELLFLAVASVFQCSNCIEKHLEGAFEAGATKEEITETLLIAVVEAGNAQLTWAKQIYSKYLGNNGHK